MKTKKIITISMACVLAFGIFAGCSQNSSSSANTASNAPEESNSPSASAESDSQNSSRSDKILVVYYSASGRTETVANTIAETLNANTFEIVPTEIYSDDDLNWNDTNSRVTREHEDESLRDVPLISTNVENWDSYDTVLIGYPIWWGIAAWPVDNFIKNNDFSGKTVIPFCTSASSGLGQSGTLLEKMSGTGSWQSGQRFSSNASDKTVSEWANSLNLK